MVPSVRIFAIRILHVVIATGPHSNFFPTTHQLLTKPPN